MVKKIAFFFLLCMVNAQLGMDQSNKPLYNFRGRPIDVAIMKGNLEDVKKYIRQGFPITNDDDEIISTPLSFSINMLSQIFYGPSREFNDDQKVTKLLNIIRYLLADGRVDINTVILEHNHYMTALDYAENLPDKRAKDLLIPLLKEAGAKHVEDL